MKKIITLFSCFFIIQLSLAQSPLNVVMTGYCAQNNGSYTYIGLLNGKNNYSYTYLLDGDPFTALIGYDNNNWILYEIDFIDNIAFSNPNVTASLVPPLTGWIPVECESDATMIITTTLSVNENQLFGSNIEIFPNPASDHITVRKDKNTNDQLEYQILDISGRIIVKNKNLYNQKIDISFLNNGHYLIEFYTNEDKKIVKKFIKK